MAGNNSISLVNLDFDTLKSSLKAYLSSQSEFVDYNFDGPNISVLLDILSYNSYLNAFFLNMAISEGFLDSAQLISSVISRAKELNYVPRSYKSSVGTIDIQIAQGAGVTSYTLSKGTKFTALNSNGTFTFTTDRNYVSYPSGGYFNFSSIPVYEGTYFTDSFTVDNNIEAQKYVFSNQKVDTDSLVVTVLENLGQNTTTFDSATSIYGLNSSSNVFFLQATSNNYYEIVFGDGIFGRKPLNGAVILANYRITTGLDGNGSTNFNSADNIGTATIQTIASSSGGANSESIESIRYNAPRHFQTQERAVTTADYKSLILSNFINIKSCHVFGGESLIGSVDYGKVYISPVTYSGSATSTSEKADIEYFLSQRCTIGITPVIVDPDFLYLQVNCIVKFNPNATILTASDISQIVSNAISSYNSTYLTDFNTTFRLSKFEQAINDADSSIFSNQTSVKLKKIASPELNTLIYIDIKYRNPIQPATIISSIFLSAGREYYFTDYNPNNNTFTVNQTSDGSSIVNSSNVLYLVDITNPQYPTYTVYGIIDYVIGSIGVNQIMINDFYNSTGVVFYATPVNQDVSSSENDVIEIDIAEGTTVSVVTV